MTELFRGADLIVSGTMLEVTFDAPEPIDLAAILLGATGRVISNAGMVFYNQPNGTGVQLSSSGGRPSLAIDLLSLPPDAVRIVVVGSLDGTRSRHFGMLPSGGLRVDVASRSGELVARCRPDLVGEQTALVLVELHRRKTWLLCAARQGWTDGLAGVAAEFGVDATGSGRVPAATQDRPAPAEAPVPPAEVPTHGSPSPSAERERVAPGRRDVAADRITSPSSSSSPDRRGRVWPLVVGGVAMVAVLAAAGATWWLEGRSSGAPPLADAETVGLPAAPPSPDGVRAYLTGPGRPVITVLDLDPLTVGGDPAPSGQACRALAPRLSEVAEPRPLRVLAERIPDDATADMATSYVDSLIAFLTSCARDAPAGREDLAFRATVLERRLVQLDVR